MEKEGILEGILFVQGDEGITLENTEVGVILSGSEEAGLRGSKAWCEAHKGEFDDVPTIILSYDIMYIWIRLYFLPNVNRRHFD